VLLRQHTIMQLDGRWHATIVTICSGPVVHNQHVVRQSVSRRRRPRTRIHVRPVDITSRHYKALYERQSQLAMADATCSCLWDRRPGRQNNGGMGHGGNDTFLWTLLPQKPNIGRISQRTGHAHPHVNITVEICWRKHDSRVAPFVKSRGMWM